MSGLLNIKIVAHNSKEYWKTIELRDKVLRKPLGLSFSDEELQAEDHQIHIAAISADQVIGCLVLKPIGSSEIKMRQVAVDTAIQGKGIGRKMVDFAEAYAAKKGFALMSLHARDVAIRFYTRLNYEKVGEPFEEVGIEHYRMEKGL